MWYFGSCSGRWMSSIRRFVRDPLSRGLLCAPPLLHPAPLRRNRPLPSPSLVKAPVHEKVGGRVGPPHVDPQVPRVPDLGHVGFLVPDLLHAAPELDDVPFGNPEVLELVVSGAVAARTVEEAVDVP